MQTVSTERTNTYSERGKRARSALRIQELAGNRARLGAGTSRCADDLETLSMLADAVSTFSIKCLRCSGARYWRVTDISKRCTGGVLSLHSLCKALTPGNAEES